jgi:hypothetical protein
VKSKASVRLACTVSALLLAIPAAAGAQIDPYAADPLGLLAFADQSRVYTSGNDVIDVFVCDVPDGSVTVDLSAAVAGMNAALQPYYTWLSGGIYLPTFVAAGTLTASLPSGWPDLVAFQSECEMLAATSATGSSAGALVIVDAAYSGGYATAGVACEATTACPTTFPDNGRIMVVGATTVVPSDGLPNARLTTIAHELGHTLEFPHSFGGLTKFINGVTYEYDNPMDIMSGGSLSDLDVGTIAINRYAAGWLASATEFHRGYTAEYQLSSLGATGRQMLVLPTDIQGVFTMIGARSAVGFDSGIVAEGVEVYSIDQRGPACGGTIDFVCWGADRRTTPLPAIDDPETSVHVFGVGETFSVGGASVTVDSESDGRWTVTVTGSTVSERFIDDNGSIHEPNISAIASLGVTLGCNPPMNSMYCPDDPVTRAEMAVFLSRAIGDEIDPTTGLGVFVDVPPSVWYTNAIARMVELGITTGYTDGTYRPNAPVSRGEMAVFIDRAFESVASSGELTAFTDVPFDAFYATATDALYDTGVTLGCQAEPLAFCPLDAVSRAEMASFLARVLAQP